MAEWPRGIEAARGIERQLNGPKGVPMGRLKCRPRGKWRGLETKR